MTHTSLVQKVTILAALSSAVVAGTGCYDEPNQAAEGDKSALERNAKKDSIWQPPGLADLGKIVGVWDSPDSGMTSATMQYVWDGFDLETATVHQAPPGDQFAPDVDFYLAYNADTENHVRLFQEYPAWVAFIEATSIEEVTCELMNAAVFTQDVVDQPLDPDDTVVVMTADGNYFKIGNAAEYEDGTVGFDFASMDCPE